MTTLAKWPGRIPDTGDSTGVRYVRTVDSPNCTGACGWIAAVKDGVIVDLKQAADYSDTSYNPRGCFRGMSMTQLIYHPDRVKKPLIRAGRRGEGNWREVSWEEALDFVAEKMKSIAARYGPESILFFNQVTGTGYVQKGAQTRLATLMHASYATAYDFNGDISMGYTETLGIDSIESESKAWAKAKTILLWGSNVLQTRIPDARFIVQAQQRGSKVVVISPRADQSAKAADFWLPIRPGTDGLLALSMARVLIEEGLIDEAFMRKYTDLPLLVRDDTGQRLRASEVGLGALEAFVAFDETTQALVALTAETLARPPQERLALRGSFQVEIDGKTVTVRPVYERLLAQLLQTQYTPEEAAKVTDIPAQTIRQLARTYATQRPAQIIVGMGVNHRYHGDLAIRAILLLGALTGGFGQPGQSIDVYSGQHHFRINVESWWYPEGKRPNMVPAHYFVMGGPTPTMNPKIHYPAEGFKGFFFSHANPFTTERSTDWDRAIERLELVVACDFMMTPSCEMADVVLPAPTFWEKWELVGTGCHPYLQIQQPVIAPLYESRSELWMMRELAKRIDPAFAPYFDYTEPEVIQMLLREGGPEAEGITFEQLLQGPVRLKVPDPDVPLLEQIQHDKPFPPRAYPHPQGAQRPFLQSGRMEFYKEEAAFQQAEETVPVYKDAWDHLSAPERAYPLALVTPHSKWRVHSTHSNNPWLRNINRKPVIEIHPKDAAVRHIEEGDLVEVYNDHGRFQLWARLTESVRPGVVAVDHGWWSRFLAAGDYHSVVTPERVNPVQEAYYLPAVYAPGQAWKDTRVEIAKVVQSS